jgi:hypothetical protein
MSTPTLKELRASLERATGHAAGLAKIVDDAKAKATKAAVAQTKADATYADALDAQAKAVAAYAADPSDANDSRLDAADSRMRKVTITRDAALEAARTMVDAYAQASSKREAADKDVERLSLEIDAHHEAIAANVSETGADLVDAARAILASLSAIVASRDAAVKTARMYGNAGHGSLLLPHSAHWSVPIIVALAKRGADVPSPAFDALVDAMRAANDYGAGCGRDPGAFLSHLFACLTAPVTPVERGENHGMTSRSELQALARELTAGRTWAEAARVAFPSTWNRHHVATSVPPRPGAPRPSPPAPPPPPTLIGPDVATFR